MTPLQGWILIGIAVFVGGRVLYHLFATRLLLAQLLDEVREGSAFVRR